MIEHPDLRGGDILIYADVIPPSQLKNCRS